MASDDHGLPLPTMVNHGQPWSTMASDDHGQPWSTMVNNVLWRWTWSTMVGVGAIYRSCPTMVYHVLRQWSTMSEPWSTIAEQWSFSRGRDSKIKLEVPAAV